MESTSQVVLFSAVISLCGLTLACGGAAISPAVASTQNPLVAQYSVASGCAGQAMVEFGPDTSYGRNTAWYPVTGDFQEINILVAGMKASTTYHMRSQVQCGADLLTSQDRTFTTGALPSTLLFPSLQVTRPQPSASSPENPGIEMVDVIAVNTPALYTDRDGNPIWYYDTGAGNAAIPFKLLSNGHVIMYVIRTTTDVLREVDLAGNTIREMDTVALGQKMQTAGFNFIPNTFHHDTLPLDNGHTIVLTNFEKSFTDLPGYPGTTNVIGDGIVDLDPDWNPVWAWNSFDYLDVNRHLNGLPDWTHSNALVYSASDGNLLLSMRHQSWVLKIDYNNGTGAGNILWKLGYQGDFTLQQNFASTDDPSLWFSFQHFPSIISQTGPQTTLTIWDNGDNRVLDSNGTVCLGSSSSPCFSRATKFQLDESVMVANLLWADPLTYFSVWGGSANQLSNDNVEFDLNAPAAPPTPNVASQVQEVTQTSTPQVVWQMNILPITSNAYRAYRVPSLYPGVTWQY
jgi:arylsulfate sulfotransferase